MAELSEVKKTYLMLCLGLINVLIRYDLGGNTLDFRRRSILIYS